MKRGSFLLVVVLGVLSVWPCPAAEDWSKQACKQARKNRDAFRAVYMESSSLGGVLKSAGKMSTENIVFHLASPQMTKRAVCELMALEGLSDVQAQEAYELRLEALQAGFIPVFIQVERDDRNFGIYAESRGRDDVRNGVLQDKKEGGPVLREMEDPEGNPLLGYYQWLRRWEGYERVFLFPYDEAFFREATQVEVDVPYGGMRGEQRRRATFPKKMGSLLIEQMTAMSQK